MVLHLDRLHTDPPKEARGMAGRDLPRRAREVWRASWPTLRANAGCTSQIESSPGWHIGSVPTRRGVRDGPALRKHRKRFPTPPQLHCLTADQRRGSYSLPAPATQSRNSER